MKRLREIIERSKISVLQERKTDEGTVMKVLVPWIEADKENQNGRIYPKSLLSREIKRLEPKIKEGAVIGTGDHPASGMADIATASHIVKKLWLDEGGTGWAELAILPTERGKNIQTIIKEGGKLGISARGFGTVDKATKKVMDDYQLQGIDIVTNPSFQNAQFSAENIFESVNFFEKDVEEEREPENINLFTEKELIEVLKSEYEKERDKGLFFGSWEEWKARHENPIREKLGFPLNKKLAKEERTFHLYREAKLAGWIGTFEEFQQKFPQKSKKRLEERVRASQKRTKPYKPSDLYLEALLAGEDPSKLAERLNKAEGLVEEKKQESPREKVEKFLKKKYKPSVYDWREIEEPEKYSMAWEKRIAGEPRKK